MLVGIIPNPYTERGAEMENRKRNIQMKFYVTEEEKRLIDEKMKQLPIKQYAALLLLISPVLYLPFSIEKYFAHTLNNTVVAESLLPVSYG